jgi:ATP-dependent DNA ligase
VSGIPCEVGPYGLGWPRRVRWPFAAGILDGELSAATGLERVKAVFEARGRVDGATFLGVFDRLALEGRSLLAEPWTVRRQALEASVRRVAEPRVRLVPTHPTQWIAWGGEGVVLKDPQAPYRPGERTRAWLKLKARAGGNVTAEQLATALRGGAPR